MCKKKNMVETDGSRERKESVRLGVVATAAFSQQWEVCLATSRSLLYLGVLDSGRTMPSSPRAEVADASYMFYHTNVLYSIAH